MNALRFRANLGDKSSQGFAPPQNRIDFAQKWSTHLSTSHAMCHTEVHLMTIPIPAETPDPNIDKPVLPETEPQPIPEQEPPGTTPPPKEEPPSTMPPVIV
jgi:hypothetical protein